jgi:hypothetical protein
MKKGLLICTFICSAIVSFSNIVINEFQPSNIATIADPEYHAYSDWIELYNNGTTDVNLSDYYLTDNSNDTTQWKFPAGTIITAGSYLLVWADAQYFGEHTIGLHTNFKLNGKGDEIALYSSSKTLLDSYSFGVIKSGTSVGRQLSNPQIWGSYLYPTPGQANSSSATFTQAPQPVMSVSSGFYSTAQTIAISVPLANATIRYTTNGTNPTLSSPIYTTPISINKNTVLKAIATQSNYATSRIVAQTYFIGERNITIPVVSIGVDSYDMFDSYSGMYSLGPNASTSMPNYGANFWEDRELPATFEYFVNGKQKVQVNTGISIHGGWSRRFDQRSFAFNCGSAYGDERINYQFFKDKNITEFKKIILKNGGSDVNQVKYRDGMISTLAHANMLVDYQGFQPTAAFVNGEYWGILNIQEKLTEDYLKNNYGLDSSAVDLLYNYSQVYAGSTDDFDQFYNYVESNNTQDNTVYQNIQSMMDIDEFIDYEIAEIYVSNHDWPGSNIRYWKQHGNGKWRWILYDTDQSFEYYMGADKTENSLYDATTEYGSGWPNPPQSTMLLRNLLLNTSFKNLFIQRFAAHMNSTFSTDSVINMVTKLETLLAGEKMPHLTRWGSTDEDWIHDYDGIVSFANERPGYMKGFIKDYFYIPSTNVLTLKATNNNTPHFKLSGVNLKGNNIVGDYFTGIPFTIEAVNEKGLTFVKWQDASGTTISTINTINVTLTSNKTYVAVYEEQPGLQNIFINEFMASNKTNIKDNANEFEDWIEIYNANSYSVDLAGTYLTDDLTNPYKFLIQAGNETTIPANGYLIFWADNEIFQGLLHTNFKLSAASGSIGLSQEINNQVSWIDSLSYGIQISDKSFGRKPDGDPNISTLTTASPGSSNKPIIIESNIVSEDDIVVYPNVTNGSLYISQKDIEPLNATIYSLLGVPVKSILCNDKHVTKVDVSDLTKGYYIIKMRTNTKTIEKRFIVK